MHSPNEAHISGLGTHVSASERDESSFEDDVVSGFEQASRTFGVENDSFIGPGYMRHGSHHRLRHGHAPLLAATQPFGESAQNNDIENFLTSPPVANSLSPAGNTNPTRPDVSAVPVEVVAGGHTPSVVVPVVSINDTAEQVRTSSSPVFTNGSSAVGPTEQTTAANAHHANTAVLNSAQPQQQPPTLASSPLVLQTQTSTTNVTRPVLQSIETTQRSRPVHVDAAPTATVATTSSSSNVPATSRQSAAAPTTVASLIRAEAARSATPARSHMTTPPHMPPSDFPSPFLTTPPNVNLTANGDRVQSHTVAAAAPSSHVFTTTNASSPALQASVSHHGTHHVVHSDQSFLATTSHAAPANVNDIPGGRVGTSSSNNNNVALWQQTQSSSQPYGPHSPLALNSPRHVPATASYSSLEGLVHRAASPEARSDRSYGRRSVSSTNNNNNLHASRAHQGRHNSGSSYVDLDAAAATSTAPSWVRAMHGASQHHSHPHLVAAASLPAHGGSGISPRRTSSNHGGGGYNGNGMRSGSGAQSVSPIRGGNNGYGTRYATSSLESGRQGFNSNGGTMAWSASAGGVSWARSGQLHQTGAMSQPPVLIAEATHHGPTPLPQQQPSSSSRPQWLSAVERAKREDYLGIYQNYDTLVPPEQNENLGLQGRRTMQQVPLTVSRINALKEGRLTTSTMVPTSPTLPSAPLFTSSAREAELPVLSAYDVGRQGRPLASLSHGHNSMKGGAEHSVRGETSSNGRGQPRSPTYSAPSARTTAWIERQHSSSSIHQGGNGGSYHNNYPHNNNNVSSSVGPHATRGRRAIVAHEEALHVNVARSASPQSLQSRRHHVRASRSSPPLTSLTNGMPGYYNGNNLFTSGGGGSAMPGPTHILAAESVRHGAPGQPATRLAMTAVSSVGSSVNTISNRAVHQNMLSTGMAGLPSLFATEKATSQGQQQAVNGKPGLITAEEQYGKTHLVSSNNTSGVNGNANPFMSSMSNGGGVVEGQVIKYGELQGGNAPQSSAGWGNMLETSENGGGLRRRLHHGNGSTNNNNNNKGSNYNNGGNNNNNSGNGGRGNGNYNNQSTAVIVNEEAKAVREVVANHPDEDDRDERNFRTRNINAVHAIPWDQRRQLPMTGFGTRFFAILSSPRFWEKLDWTLRGSILTVLPTMILSMEPTSAPHFPLPSMLAFNAFWITMPTFGSGMREFYIALKGFSIGLTLSIVLLAIRPGPAWLTIILHFIFTLATSFIGQETKKTCAFVLATIYMQYIINPNNTHYSYVRDYFFSILIALGFALAGFIIPFIRWSSEIARHYLVAMSTALSIGVQGTCSSFWTRSPLERELNVVRLRQLRVTAEKCIQKIDVAMSEMGYEPHTGRYTAQLRSRYEFCIRIHNILGSMMTVIELIASEPRLIDTPMCTVFGQQIGDDLAIISSAMDSMILKIVDVRRPISVQELAFFREARERFQAALSRVREDVILTNENYEADESDVYLGFFMFSVDELCETIATFDPDVQGRNNLIYFLTFWWRDILSTLSAFKILFLTIIRRRTITRRLKEAIKLTLCTNIPLIFQVYALSNNATSPMAGSAIIALVYNPTGSESFHYASGRLQGTVIGSLAALLSVQIAHGRRWVLYIFIALLSIIGSYVQAAPGFYALGNAIVCSVISVMTQYDDQNAAIVRIQQNCFAILLYFVIVSVVWPMRGHTKVKMGLDVSLRCLRESTTRLLRNLDMPDEPLEVIADVSALLKEMSRKIALQVKFIPGALEEPTLASAEFPEEAWKDLITAQRKLYLTLSMMCFAYQTFMSSRANNDTELSVHWVILRRISGYARDLSDLIYAAVDLYLISLAKVTVVPTAHLTRLRRSMMEAHMAILETYIRTVHRQVVGDDSTADNNGEEEEDDGGSGSGGMDDDDEDNYSNEGGGDSVDPGMHVKDHRRRTRDAQHNNNRHGPRRGNGNAANSAMSSNSAHYAASWGSFEGRVSSIGDSLHGVSNNNNNNAAAGPGGQVNVPANNTQGQGQVLLLAGNQPGNARDATQPVQSLSFANSSLGPGNAREKNNSSNNNNNKKAARPGLSNSNNNNAAAGEANNEDNNNNNNASGKKKTVYMSYNLTAEEKAALKALISTQANNSNLHRSFAVKASALLNAVEAGERTRGQNTNTNTNAVTVAGAAGAAGAPSAAYNDSKMLALAGTNEDLAAKLRKKHGITIDKLDGTTGASNTNPVSPHSGDGIGAAPTAANANKNAADEATKVNMHNNNNNNNTATTAGAGNMSPDVAMEVLKNSSFLKNTSFLGNLFKRSKDHGRHDTDAEHSDDDNNNENNDEKKKGKKSSKKSKRNNNNENSGTDNNNTSSSNSDNDDDDATEPSEHECTEAPGQTKSTRRTQNKNTATSRLRSQDEKAARKAARQAHTTPNSPVGSDLAVEEDNDNNEVVVVGEEETRQGRGTASKTPTSALRKGQKPPFAMASSAPTASPTKVGATMTTWIDPLSQKKGNRQTTAQTPVGTTGDKVNTLLTTTTATQEGMQQVVLASSADTKPTVQNSYVSLSVTPPGVDIVHVEATNDDDDAERASVQQIVNDSSVFGADDEDAAVGQHQPQTTRNGDANDLQVDAKRITIHTTTTTAVNGKDGTNATSDSGPHSDHTADKPTTTTATTVNTNSTTPMCVSASDEKRLSEDPSHTPLQDDDDNNNKTKKSASGANVNNLSLLSASGNQANKEGHRSSRALLLDPNSPRVRWGSPDGNADAGPLGPQCEDGDGNSEGMNSSQRTSEMLRNISFFDADRGEFILTNHDIHSLEAFLFGTRALVVYINELQNALLEMQHESDLAKNL